ncbi:hypothetical protein ACH4C2_08690 [Streptomyces sp. NPDC018057]|uniref:hypothetical protein n=1 Tax=unclassified Streptomyces TaxID=2593676 RepID=UPI0037AA6F73
MKEHAEGRDAHERDERDERDEDAREGREDARTRHESGAPSDEVHGSDEVYGSDEALESHEAGEPHEAREPHEDRAPAADPPDEPRAEADRASRAPRAAREQQQHPHTSPPSGNTTVNDSPDAEGPDPERTAPADEAPGGLAPDELALRRLLHRAVQDVGPSDGTLEHLRRAIPARRARKRQATVGMAAAALFLGTAVPALVHVSRSAGPDANPAIAGQASQAQGGAGRSQDPAAGPGTEGSPSDRAAGRERGGEKDGTATGGATATGAVPGGAPDLPSASARAGAPMCTAAQLGSGGARLGTPDASGAVYGVLRVTNTSSGSCTVGGPGTVTSFPQGAAEAARVSVVQHTPGDAAPGLPDPSTESPALVLTPGSGYEVKFAWVPSDSCPTTGGSGGSGGTGGTGGGGSGGTETGQPSPGPSPSKDQGAAGGPAANSGSGTDTGSAASPQLVREDGAKADGSVVVSHTPEPGSPTVSATVPDACAGTVYHTGVLAAATP